MRKLVKWTGIILLSPVVLFVILSILLYIPPVQNFLVGKAVAIASEKTGMQISIARITLSFPLDLVVKGVRVVSEKDTLLDVDRLQVDVQLLPLLRKQVEIDAIRLQSARVNSAGLIEGMVISGSLGDFYLESHGVDLATEEALVNRAELKDTHLKLSLTDTAQTPKDSTSKPVQWKFAVQRLALQNVTFAMDMPGDSLSLFARLDSAALKDGHVDLQHQAYRVRSVDLRNGLFRFDTGNKAVSQGFDPSHILVRDLRLSADSLLYRENAVQGVIRRFSLRERSGLEVVSLQGKVYSDSTSLSVPLLTLQTQHSDLRLQAIADWSAVRQLTEGAVRVDLSAQIGKQDVMLFAGALPDDFERAYPLNPLMIRAGVKGNMNRLNLDMLRCRLPGAFDFSASGEVTAVLDSVKRSAVAGFRCEAQNLDFVLGLLDAAQRKQFAIPRGMILEGKAGMTGSRYSTDMVLAEGGGKLVFSGQFDPQAETYQADLALDKLQLHDFMPHDSLYALTASVTAQGRGFDFFSPRTYARADLAVHDFFFGHYDLSGIRLDATLAGGLAKAGLQSTNPLLTLQADLEAWLSHKGIRAALHLDAPRLDWYGLRLVAEPFETSLDFDLKAETDLKEMYSLEGGFTDIHLITPKKNLRTKDLLFSASTDRDSTRAAIRAGDLDVLLQARGGLDLLILESTRFASALTRQIGEKKIDQDELRSLMPGSCLRVSAGRDNPLSNYLTVSGIRFNSFLFDVDTSPEKGMNADAHLYSLRKDSLQLDTIRFSVRQDTAAVRLSAGVINAPGNKQFVFTARADVEIYENSAELMLNFLNGKGETGVMLGIRALLRDDGVEFRLFPDRPTLVFRPFTVNPNNYIFVGNDKHVRADVQLFDKKGTGLKIYSLEDPDALQDIAVELRQVDLAEVMQIMPYLPDIRGMLSAELHYVKTETTMQVAADVQVDSLTYEQQLIGNVALGGVYLPGEQDVHHLDAYVNYNGKEVVTLGGIYRAAGKGSLEAEAAFEHFPLKIANAFIPGGYAELSGDVDGTFQVAGPPDRPKIDGTLRFDSVSVFVVQAGARFRFDDEPLKVESGRLIFRDFDIYTQGKNPFTINGKVDFSDFSKMSADLKLDAQNYELLNAPRTKESLVYGKVFVDFNATVRGPLETLIMRGNMKLQGNTDVTYVLKDSPLTVQDRLGDLVTFVNFNDTTGLTPEQEKTISLGGLDMLMTIQIDPAVKLKVDLSADRESRVELEGGGDLSLQYTPQGDLMLTGRYTLVSGLLKYSLSFISKTFTVQNGSYVDWTGNVMNPTLNITALERVRTSVAPDNQQPRPVNFDVSIAIRNQLKDLDIVFDLATPEDAAVQNQLTAAGAEERSKLAVAMLATGMYLGAGGSSGGNLSMSGALNSFLQQQLASLAGGALSKIDITLGVESNDGTDGSGKQTDFSFRFAKRFWNNRLSVIIGGKVSTGENVQNSAQSFIDNVALEWRLDNSGTRYIKLFHDKNYENILEGEITETGVGLVLRKKMDRLRQLFIFRKPKPAVKTESNGGKNTK